MKYLEKKFTLPTSSNRITQEEWDSLFISLDEEVLEEFSKTNSSKSYIRDCQFRPVSEMSKEEVANANRLYEEGKSANWKPLNNDDEQDGA